MRSNFLTILLAGFDTHANLIEPLYAVDNGAHTGVPYVLQLDEEYYMSDIAGIFSLFAGILISLIFGIPFIAVGAGDFLIILRLMKENKEDYILGILSETNSAPVYRKINCK